MTNGYFRLFLLLSVLCIASCSESANPVDSDGPSRGKADSSTGTAPVPSWTIGLSEEQRLMVAESYGFEGPVLLVLSAIHGNERLALTYGERFRTELLSGYADRHGIRVIFLQVANPDGVMRRSRENAGFIDLNRDFPTSNRYDDNAHSGLESVYIKDLVDASNLTAALSVHCCIPTFDWDGPAGELAEGMSEAMLPEVYFGTQTLGASAGSLGSYVGLDLGLPIITVEFAVGTEIEPLLQLQQMTKAFEAAGDWVSRQSGVGPAFESMPNVEDPSYESAWLAESAAGVPLRVERIRAEYPIREEPVFLLAGFGAPTRTGAWVAESLRRELISMGRLQDMNWEIVTAVNPDGIANGSALNGSGISVLEDLALDSPVTPEGRAIRNLLGDNPKRIFLFKDAGPDAANTVEIRGPDRADLESRLDPALFTLAEDSEDSLLSSLSEEGHTVILFTVSAEYFEAQYWDDAFDENQQSARPVYELMMGLVD